MPRFALPAPPPPPRPIADRYVWRIMSSDGATVAAGIFAFLGAIFSFIGFILTIAIVTAFVGVPFLIFGLVTLGISVPILRRRHQAAVETVNVLREGLAAQGEITSLEQNHHVQVNGRYPWNIAYQFEVNGRPYTGQLSTLSTPSPQLQVGQPACVLYAPNAPEKNTLYPRP